MMNKPIFVSGSHGSGKTTLINKLLKKYNVFMDNDFDLDFSIEFSGLKQLSDFERCLIRLYHRIYLTTHSYEMAETNPDKVIITSRGIYDSEAYINTYSRGDWISKNQKDKLDFILNNRILQPYTIILNPPFEVIKERLTNRINQHTRALRDDLFKREDTDEFLKVMNVYFEGYKGKENVLYIEDNSDAEIEKIMVWIESINNSEQILQREDMLCY